MAQLAPRSKEIEAKGSLVFIAPQRRGGLIGDPVKFFAGRKSLQEFPFLLDEDRSVTKAYGVYHRFGHDAYDIARPATFVVGQDHRIRYVFVSEAQHEGAPLDEVFAVFFGL